MPVAATNLNINGFAATPPDGKHFLMVNTDLEAVPTRLHIIFNFFDELKRLVPAGK